MCAELSKTAKASMRSGPSQPKDDAFASTEAKIAELRKLREARLAINRHDFIDALLAEYDRLAEECKKLTEANTWMKATNEAHAKLIEKLKVEQSNTLEAIATQE